MDPGPVRGRGAVEELFRHKVLGLLRRRGLRSRERIQLLLSWRRSGFSVHNRVYAHPGDGRDFEALVRYMMRSPVSLTRLRFTPGAKEVVYARKGGHDGLEPGKEVRDSSGARPARSNIGRGPRLRPDALPPVSPVS